MADLCKTLVYPQTWPLSIQIILALIFIFAFTGMILRPSVPENAPRFVKGWPLLGSLEWFGSRRNFLFDKKREHDGQFSFSYGPYPIVALFGEEGRATFFGARGMDFIQGVRDLAAAGPQGEFVCGGLDTYFITTLKRFGTTERYKVALPYVVNDAYETIAKFRAEKTVIISPFKVMFELIYKLSHRILGSHDVAEDPKLLATTLPLASCLAEASACEILFPWLPMPTKLYKIWASGKLAWIISRVAKKRRSSGKQVDDMMQTLINHGHDNLHIAAFIAASIFAGTANTGHNAGWIIAYVAEDRYWYSETQKEVDNVLSKYRQSEDETPLDIFQRLTMEQWETEFPLIQFGLRDSIRLAFVGSMLRKNISGKDIKIGSTGKVVPKDQYAVYLFDDVHFDEDVYANSSKWDPGRYLPDRAEDQKVPQAYLGWGTGLHPCLGTRIAKIEVAVTTAMFMAYYDFHLCDKYGMRWETPLKKPARNESVGTITSNEEVFLKLKARV